MQRDGQLVEQIVRGVLEQLRTSAPARRADDVAAAPPMPERRKASAAPKPDGVVLTDRVITADLLQQRVGGSRRIVVGPRSILTPAAHDFLRQAGIEWSRAAGDAAGAAGTSALWTALVLTAAPAVATALEELVRSGSPRWQRELVGSSAEVVEKGVSAICRGESPGVAVFAEPADLIACRANRNPQVRAVVVTDVPHVRGVRETMGANLIVIRPGGKGSFELRTMLRTFATTGPPQPPADWMEG